MPSKIAVPPWVYASPTESQRRPFRALCERLLRVIAMNLWTPLQLDHDRVFRPRAKRWVKTTRSYTSVADCVSLVSGDPGSSAGRHRAEGYTGTPVPPPPALTDTVAGSHSPVFLVVLHFTRRSGGILFPVVALPPVLPPVSMQHPIHILIGVKWWENDGTCRGPIAPTRLARATTCPTTCSHPPRPRRPRRRSNGRRSTRFSRQVTTTTTTTTTTTQLC
jgi:hypothetical protein